MIWTSYAGVEVVEVDSQVKCRHPRWGYDPMRLATLKGASLLLLVDETLLVVCDECGYNGLTGSDPYVKPEGEYRSIIKQADSLLSHINGTHHSGKVSRRATMYTEGQIKVAVKTWLKWRGAGVKNWTQSACDELEKRGFKPLYAEHWTPVQLGSLVRGYMKKSEFKNLKAAPMVDEPEQESLVAMVRDAVAREGRRGTHVADNVRITQQRVPHKHTPIDFEKIIADAEATKGVRQKEEVSVSGTDHISEATSNPILNFVDSGVESTPTKTLVIEQSASSFTPAPRQPEVVVVPKVESEYEHVLELDGTPLFKYKGVLMAGKPVKGIEV